MGGAWIRPYHDATIGAPARKRATTSLSIAEVTNGMSARMTTAASERLGDVVHADPDRAVHALRVARVPHGLDRQTLHRRGHAFGLEAEHHDDRRETGLERAPGGPPHQRLALQLDQKLVAAET